MARLTEALVWPELFSSFAKLGPGSSRFGDVGQIRLDFGHVFVRFGQTCAVSSRIGPISSRIGPISYSIGPDSERIGRIRMLLARVGPKNRRGSHVKLEECSESPDVSLESASWHLDSSHDCAPPRKRCQACAPGAPSAQPCADAPRLADAGLVARPLQRLGVADGEPGGQRGARQDEASSRRTRSMGGGLPPQGVRNLRISA